MVAMDRRAATAALLQDRGDLLIVTGLGSPTYDVHAAGDHVANFYLWGAMGGAALVGLGLAQAQPGRRVLVVTGDGEQLMGLGGLATIAVARPPNLTVAVLDNQHYGETGQQRSHTGHGVDLASVARGCGIQHVQTAHDLAGVAAMRTALHEAGVGPRIFILAVSADPQPRSLPARDAIFLKNRFRAALGLAVS